MSQTNQTMNDYDRYRYVCCIIGITLILALAAMCIGCKSVQYVPVETVRTDTCYINRLRTDSLVIRDSLVVDRKGDTVFVDRWRWRERYTNRTDTLYRSRVDTIAVPYPVERKQSRMERVKSVLGDIAIGITAIILAVGLFLAIKRKMD